MVAEGKNHAGHIWSADYAKGESVYTWNSCYIAILYQKAIYMKKGNLL